MSWFFSLLKSEYSDLIAVLVLSISKWFWVFFSKMLTITALEVEKQFITK